MKVVVGVTRETNRLVARALKLGPEKMDDFWVDAIGSVLPLIIDASGLRLTEDEETAAFRVYQLPAQEVPMSPVILTHSQPRPEYEAHLNSKALAVPNVLRES